jgi:hypothetical protein
MATKDIKSVVPETISWLIGATFGASVVLGFATSPGFWLVSAVAGALTALEFLTWVLD